MQNNSDCAVSCVWGWVTPLRGLDLFVLLVPLTELLVGE